MEANDDARIVLGTLSFGDGRSASFELRGGRWLADDPGRRLRWHDGPFAVEGRDTVLLISNDLGPALRLQGLDPAAVRKDDAGTGVLIEAGDHARPRTPLQWQITSVVGEP